MKIILAENRGMCFGVKRAIDIANSASVLGQEEIYTLGPIVHNGHVISDLEKKGVKIAGSIDELNRGSVIIRAHGAPQKTIDEIEEKNVKIIDATCPFVAKAKEKAAELESKGYKVVILGEEDHPEVISIAGSIKDPIIIENSEKAKNVGQYSKIGIVSQTTQPVENFDAVAEELKKHCKELRTEKTICNATILRQGSAKETALKSDLMIIVGDRKSANTNQLLNLCSKITESRLVEDASELEEGWFKNISAVGVTAGASTPDHIIGNVVKRLKEF